MSDRFAATMALIVLSVVCIVLAVSLQPSGVASYLLGTGAAGVLLLAYLVYTTRTTDESRYGGDDV